MKMSEDSRDAFTIRDATIDYFHADYFLNYPSVFI